MCVCVDACSGRTVGASGHWLTAVNTSTCNTPAKHLERVLSTLESAKHLERVLSTLESAKHLERLLSTLESAKHLGEW